LSAEQAAAGWYPDPEGSEQQRYWDGQQWTEHYAPANTGSATWSGSPSVGAEPEGCLLHVKSHDAGKNADIYVFADRIERVKQARKLSPSKAHRDAETIPMRSIGSVQTKKENMRFTHVWVTTVGQPISFRVAHGDAQRLRDLISQLVLNREAGLATAALAAASPAVPTAAPPSAAAESRLSVADELKKLAELRDAGVLSAEEFGAQKAKLLGS
jgi:hypothetical protein